MKKVLIGLVVILLIIGWKAGHVSVSMYKQKSAWEQKGKNYADQQTSIVNVERVSLYHGDERYIVVEGENKRATEWIVWFSEEGTLKKRARMDEMTPREQIEQQVRKESTDIQWLRIQPGLDELTPTWEVIYQNEQGQIQYTYFDMKTGKSLRSFRMRELT